MLGDYERRCFEEIGRIGSGELVVLMEIECAGFAAVNRKKQHNTKTTTITRRKKSEGASMAIQTRESVRYFCEMKS